MSIAINAIASRIFIIRIIFLTFLNFLVLSIHHFTCRYNKAYLLFPPLETTWLFTNFRVANESLSVSSRCSLIIFKLLLNLGIIIFSIALDLLFVLSISFSNLRIDDSFWDTARSSMNILLKSIIASYMDTGTE